MKFSPRRYALCFLATTFFLSSSLVAAGQQKQTPNTHNSTIPERIQFIVEGCHIYKVTKAQCAYILATVEHETAHTWLPVREAFWMSEAWRKANHWYYPFDGRGYVQLTHGYNYQRMGAMLGTDLFNYPDKAMEPFLAREILFKGMLKGSFTGKKLGQYIINSLSYSKEARQVVNGNDRAEQISKRAFFWFSKLTVY
jgi:hypothetical protein